MTLLCSTVGFSCLLSHRDATLHRPSIYALAQSRKHHKATKDCEMISDRCTHLPYSPSKTRTPKEVAFASLRSHDIILQHSFTVWSPSISFSFCLLTERQSRKVLHECTSQWWWQTRFRWTCHHHYWTGRWPWCRTWLMLMEMDRNRWALLWVMHELIMYTLNAVQVALHKCLCQMHAYKCECKLYILRAGIFNLLLRTSKKMIPFQSWRK